LLASLLGFIGLSLSIDYGSKVSKRSNYYAVLEDNEFPLNFGFEVIAGGIAIVALIGAAINKNIEEAQLVLVLGCLGYVRHIRLKPVMAQLVETVDATYANSAKYAREYADTVAFYNLCGAGFLVVLVGMQFQSIAVSKVKENTVLYRIPFAAIFTAMLFGVLLQDLLFDYGATDWRNAARYYITGVTTKFPFDMYLDVVSGLAVAALVANIAMYRSIYDLASLLPAAAMFFIDVTKLKPATEGLKLLTKTTTTLEKLYVECPAGSPLILKEGDAFDDSCEGNRELWLEEREFVALPILGELKTYHTLLVPIFLVAILLQIFGSRFVRVISDEEKAAAKAKKEQKSKTAASEKAWKEKEAADSEVSKEERAKRHKLRKEQAELTQRRLEKAERKLMKKTNKKEQDLWTAGKPAKKGGRK